MTRFATLFLAITGGIIARSVYDVVVVVMNGGDRAEAMMAVGYLVLTVFAAVLALILWGLIRWFDGYNERGEE